jgi:MFS family permease
MAAGARFLWRDHPLRQVTLVCGVALLVVGFSESVCFAVVDVGLGRPPAFLGVLLSVQGVGAILGGLTASLAIRRFGEATAVGLGLGLFGTGAFLLGATGLPVVFVGFAVAGSGLPWVIVGFYTLMQRRTPSSLMGRVSAATDVLIGVPQTVSIGVGALLVAVVDYRLLLDVMAIVLLGCAAYLAARPAQWHATPEQPSDLGSTDVV